MVVANHGPSSIYNDSCKFRGQCCKKVSQSLHQIFAKIHQIFHQIQKSLKSGVNWVQQTQFMPYIGGF